jgi:hypothetical protein
MRLCDEVMQHGIPAVSRQSVLAISISQISCTSTASVGRHVIQELNGLVVLERNVAHLNRLGAGCGCRQTR